MLPEPGGNTLCAKAAGRAKAEGRTRHEWRPAGNTAGPRATGRVTGKQEGAHTGHLRTLLPNHDPWLVKHRLISNLSW